MTAYIGKDRIVAAVRGQYTDRVPTTVMFGAYVAKLAGITMLEFYTDAEKHAKSHVRACEVFHPDTITLTDDVYLEAQALGAKVEFPEDSTSHLASYVLEDKAKLAKLSIPEPNKDNRLSYYLEACERAISEIKDSSVGGGATGPWTLAADLRGLERLIFDTADDPNFVHELMKFTTELVKVWGAKIREVGVGIGMGEASASCSVISPKIYRTFVKPYHCEVAEYFKQRKVHIGLHICGYIDPIMEDILDTGIGMISIDSLSSLGRLVELAQGRAVIMGNVPTALFAEGTKQQMEAAVKECVDTAAKGSKYILCSGCDIPLNSRKEIVDWFMGAADKYGRYN